MVGGVLAILLFIGATDSALADAVDLSGRFAHYDIVTYVEKGPLNHTIRSMVVSYGITDLTWSNGRLIETDQFCSSKFLSNRPGRSEVSDDFTRSIRPAPTAVQISESNGEIRLLRPETPTPVGIAMDPNETLPTNRTDPRIFDADSDGKPGVTVKLHLGLFHAEIYLIRRERYSYELTWTPNEPNTINGVVHDKSEQTVIGASPSFLGVASNPSQHQDKTLSPIRLVRVDSSFGCTDLSEQRDQLFPPEPESVYETP